MRDPKVFELANFVKEYIEKSDHPEYWNKYKDSISFPEKIFAPIFFFSPLENIKKQLEEFETMLKQAEFEYRSKNGI